MKPRRQRAQGSISTTIVLSFTALITAVTLLVVGSS